MFFFSSFLSCNLGEGKEKGKRLSPHLCLNFCGGGTFSNVTLYTCAIYYYLFAEQCSKIRTEVGFRLQEIENRKSDR